MSDLNQLRDEIHDWAKGKGWWDEPREFGTLLALCHSELSEALEEYRDHHPADEVYYRHNYNPASAPILSEDFLINTISLPGGHIEDIRNPRVSGLDLQFTETYEEGEVLEVREDRNKVQHLVIADQHKMPFVRGVSIGKPEGVPSELADTIIRILDMCGHYGIDIGEVVKQKMLYNGTRPYKHGGRAI